MSDITRAALELQAFCDQQGWKSCIIGALAAIRWGDPRATSDVHLSLLTGFGDEDAYIKPLLDNSSARIEDAQLFAREGRVVLLQATNGISLDVALAAMPFEEECIARATSFEFEPGCFLRTASAEDVVIMKALAARGTDWQDVEGVLIRQQNRLDWDYSAGS